MRILAVVLLLLVAACDQPPRLVSVQQVAAAQPPSTTPRALAAVSQLLGVALRNGVGGVMIIGIDLEGPAAAAGARVGDFIVGVNGEPVASEADLVSLVGAAPANTLAVHLWRQGEKRQVAMALNASQPALQEPALEKSPAATLGLEVRVLPSAQARSIGLEFGLMITKVRSPADRSRILPGDVIVAVNQTPVHSLEEFNRMISESGAGTISLVVRRAESDLYIALQPEDTSKGRRPTDTPLRT